MIRYDIWKMDTDAWMSLLDCAAPRWNNPQRDWDRDLVEPLRKYLRENYQATWEGSGGESHFRFVNERGYTLFILRWL